MICRRYAIFSNDTNNEYDYNDYQYQPIMT